MLHLCVVKEHNVFTFLSPLFYFIYISGIYNMYPFGTVIAI